MDQELHRLMQQIDYMDFALEDYFSWEEDEKKQLTKDILTMLAPLTRLGAPHREGIMIGIARAKEEAIEHEEYEHADILDRCLKDLHKML